MTIGSVFVLGFASPTRAGPVVVELFTSQGCSSCPDADRLLSTWGFAEFKKGGVLPLSFNVDYWNYLGWKDVFSAPAWSTRQSLYAQALGDRTYTPQMVVAGRESFVGSDGDRARAAVSRYAGEAPKARMALSILSSPRVKLEAAATPVSPGASGLHVMLVLFETGLSTDVRAGENAGRVLRNDFVVRRLVDLGPLDGDKKFKRRWEVAADPAGSKAQEGAAIFLQDPRTLAVSDAQVLYPLAK